MYMIISVNENIINGFITNLKLFFLKKFDSIMIRKSIMNSLNSEYVDSELILFINIEIQLSTRMI